MGLHQLTPPPDANKPRKRKGRGHSAGQGKTAGKGHKGQHARKSGNPGRGFEGGQMPLHRRLPKRGFNNGPFRLEFEVINVADLDRFEDGAVVDWTALHEAGLVRRPGNADGLKVLGNGELSRKLTIKANKFSAGARAKIEAAGGTVEVI